jgi:hypothetical protein
MHAWCTTLMLRAQTPHLHRARSCAWRRWLPTPAASCAAGYAWGEDGSNQCPTSYYAIVNEAACETAATAAGKAYVRSETDPSYPSGCYLYQDGGGFFFNADVVGAGVLGVQLLCSGAARLARPAEAPRGQQFTKTHGLPWGTRRTTRTVLWGYSRATLGYSRATMRALTGYTRGRHGLLWGTHE